MPACVEYVLIRSNLLMAAGRRMVDARDARAEQARIRWEEEKLPAAEVFQK